MERERSHQKDVFCIKKQPHKLFLTCRFAEKQTCTAQHDKSLSVWGKLAQKKKWSENNISCVSFADDKVSNMSSIPMRQQLGMVKDELEPWLQHSRLYNHICSSSLYGKKILKCHLPYIFASCFALFVRRWLHGKRSIASCSQGNSISSRNVCVLENFSSECLFSRSKPDFQILFQLLFI